VVSPFANVHKTGYSEEPGDISSMRIRSGKEDVTVLRRSGPDDVVITEEWFREYSWGCETETIGEVTPNPSIERTSPGKPGAASHVKR
jgi:hypothetical protein